MNQAAHQLYKRYTASNEAHRRLHRIQRMDERLAYIRRTYHTLYDEAILVQRVPFMERYGQWYTRTLYFRAWFDTVVLRGRLEVSFVMDDAGYVNRPRTIANEFDLSATQLLTRTEIILGALNDHVGDDALGAIVPTIVATMRNKIAQLSRSILGNAHLALVRVSDNRLPVWLRARVLDYAYPSFVAP